MLTSFLLAGPLLQGTVFSRNKFICRTGLSLLALALILMPPVAYSLGEDENDASQITNPSSTNEGEKTDDSSNKVEQINQADTSAEKPAKPGQDSFQPSEEISEDLSVAFPVDI